MTAKEIKKIVDDERAEQLTAQLCRHWEVATRRLEELVQDLADGMDTCVEAEVYAAVMRMQSAVMAIMELNKIPSAYLFSEYLDRISKTVSNAGMRRSVMTLVQRLLNHQPARQRALFFDLVTQILAQHRALPKEKQEAIEQKCSPIQHIFAVCAQHLKPDDLMMVAQVIKSINTEGETLSQEEITGHLQKMRQAMDSLSVKMAENQQKMLILLLLLMLLPELLVGLMRQSRSNSKAMGDLFNKVLLRVRESNVWWEYWREDRETLKVVNDGLSWKEIMKAEQSKERAELGKVPGGLFAKWTTDRKAFDEDFLDAHLSDDDLRSFIFHLATLAEIARELNPTTKFGNERLVKDETQKVGDAVLEGFHLGVDAHLCVVPPIRTDVAGVDSERRDLCPSESDAPESA